MRIILSRTDSIGDVVLTLPVASALKKEIPDCTIIFLGREYTRPVVELCRNVDECVVWNEQINLEKLKADVIIHVFPVKEICQAAKRAKIPLRIATSGRFYTWLTCNKILRIPRKNSDLHEAQLNLKLLKGLNIRSEYELSEIPEMYGVQTSNVKSQTSNVKSQTSDDNCQMDMAENSHFAFHISHLKKVILHPKSKGSAREWGLDNFSKLIELLPVEKFEIFVGGTKEEGKLMEKFLKRHEGRINDLTGKLTLNEYISLISQSDVLVAASTGPLHIAAALGIKAIGLFAPMRPIFPKRWAPIGKNATFLVLDKNCNLCRRSANCECIREVDPQSVAELILGCRE